MQFYSALMQNYVCCCSSLAACWLIVQFNFLVRFNYYFYSELILDKSRVKRVLIFYLSIMDVFFSPKDLLMLYMKNKAEKEM